MLDKKLSSSEIEDAAKSCHLEIALLQALIEVESGGGGFLPDSQVKILFERHVLYRRLQIPGRQIDPGPLSKAHPELCGARWDPRHFPYGPSSSQWVKVAFVTAWAQKNDPRRFESYKKAAYESCSYGLMQILGLHYESAGFPSVYEFKHAMEESELRQLEISLHWMDQTGILEKLRSKNWSAFVRAFNGSGQVTAYRNKLIAAYERYAKQSIG